MPLHVPADIVSLFGVGLDLQDLPPTNIALTMPSESDSLTDPNMLHIFWSALRWRHDEKAKPTTWLELFGLYRLMGGGPGPVIALNRGRS